MRISDTRFVFTWNRIDTKIPIIAHSKRKPTSAHREQANSTPKGHSRESNPQPECRQCSPTEPLPQYILYLLILTISTNFLYVD